ncbi:hypothetical protein H0H93_002022 [Arthromyces matolae]|nr:hypothetical protein H0H93_002022 [Arthromyces matolae]
MQLPVAHYDPRFRRGANCAQIVKHIAAHNQSLSTLFILGMPPSRADKLVCALPQLRHLTATRLKATGLQHLAGLSTLESLHLYFTEELSLDLLDETSFLSLRSLTAYCSGLIISIKLVHKLAHSPLTRMRIMVNMKPIQKTQRHPEGNFGESPPFSWYCPDSLTIVIA